MRFFLRIPGMERCSLLSLPVRPAASGVSVRAPSETANALSAATVVQPTLLCRRCDASPEFSSVSELRAHFRLLHVRAPGAARAGGDGEGGSGSGSSNSSSSESDEDGDGGEGAPEAGSAEEVGGVSGPLVCVAFDDAGSGPVWVYRALLMTSRNKAIAAVAADLRSTAGSVPPLDLPFADLIAPGETWAVFAL